MKRVILLIFIIIVSMGLAYALAYYISITSFAFAMALNFLLMASLLSLTETLKSEYNSSYFDVRLWENKGKIYESFGINYYRKILVLIGWEKMNKKSKAVEKDTNSLVKLHCHTKQDELNHLIILVIVLGFNVFVAIKYGILKSLWLLILNILLNLYPIFLQRFNRPRIARIINISNKKT